MSWPQQQQQQQWGAWPQQQQQQQQQQPQQQRPGWPAAAPAAAPGWGVPAQQPMQQQPAVGGWGQQPVAPQQNAWAAAAAAQQQRSPAAPAGWGVPAQQPSPVASGWGQQAPSPAMMQQQQPKPTGWGVPAQQASPVAGGWGQAAAVASPMMQQQQQPPKPTGWGVVPAATGSPLTATPPPAAASGWGAAIKSPGMPSPVVPAAQGSPAAAPAAASWGVPAASPAASASPAAPAAGTPEAAPAAPQQSQEGMTPTRPAPTGPVEVDKDTRDAAKDMDEKHWADAKALLERVLNPSTGGDPSFAPAMLAMRELRFSAPGLFVPDPTDQLKQSAMTLGPLAKRKCEAWFTAVIEKATLGADEKDKPSGTLVLCCAVWKNLSTDPAALSQAAELYKRAAELGSARAMCYLGFCHQNGVGVSKKDEGEALKWYKEASEKGDVMAGQLFAQMQAFQAQQKQAAAMLEAQKAQQEEMKRQQAAMLAQQFAQQDMMTAMTIAQSLQQMDMGQLGLAKMTLDKIADKKFPPLLLLTRELWFSSPKNAGSSADQTEPLRRQIEATPIELRDRCWHVFDMLMQVTPKPSPYSYLLAGLWKFYVEENNAERLRLLNIASGLGLARAHFYLAMASFAGNGTPKDDEAGMALLQEAAEKGHDAFAQMMYGIKTSNQKFIKAAIEQGIPEGITLAFKERDFQLEIESEHMTRYAINALDKGDHKTAHELIENAWVIDQNFGPLKILRHEFRLGFPQYYPGPDITRDEQHLCSELSLAHKSRTMKFLEILTAFKSDSSWATLVRACWLHSLPSMPGFPHTQLFKVAAEKNKNPRAQCYLGLYYLNGQGGLPIDPAEAVTQFKLAVEQKDATAQYQLGLCYLNGTGIKKDVAEAARLFRLSANQNDCEAQCELGLSLRTARGVPEDWPEAKQWFTTSVANLCSRAQAELDITIELMRNREQEVLLKKAIATLDAGVNAKSLQDAKSILEQCLGLFDEYFPARILIAEVRIALPRLFPADYVILSCTGRMPFMERTFEYISGLLQASPKSPFTVLTNALWQQFIHNDTAECEKLLAAGSELGNLRCKVHLATALAQKGSLEQAAKLLGEASNGDDSEAHLLYGDCLSHAKGLPYDNLAEAKKRYEQAKANGYIAEADVRIHHLEVESLVKEAIIAFDGKKLADARKKTSDALAKAYFGPAVLMQLMLSLSESCPTQDYTKDLKVPSMLSKCDADWDQIFIDEVLCDLRTTCPIGLVIAAFWRLHRENNVSSAVILLRKASEKNCARGQVALGEELIGSRTKRDEALTFFRAASAQSDLLGQLRLVHALLEDPTPSNAAEAFKTLQIAVATTYHPVQTQLAHLYAKGLGTTQNWAEAAKWYRAAANQNNAEAECELARCLMLAHGTAEDWPEAHEWFQKSLTGGWKDGANDMATLEEWMRNREQEGLLLQAVVAAGAKKFAEAKKLLDDCLDLFDQYVPALLLKQEVRRALPKLFTPDTDVKLEPHLKKSIEKLSTEHNKRAATYIANKISNSKLGMPAGTLLGACWKHQVDKDGAAALALFRTASDMGSARACFHVGEFSAKGWNLPAIDNAAASIFYKKAAAQEDAEGVFFVAMAETNALEQVKGLRLSAGLGFRDAQFQLGNHFRAGTGINQSLEEAIKLFISAADQGLTDAEFEAGIALLNGVAVKKDETRGAAYLSRAAAKGNPEACYRFGLCLLNGVGVGSNDRAAGKMFSTAAAGGIQAASKELDRLQAKWREEELKAAQEETLWAQRRAAEAQSDAAREQQRAAEATRRYFR